MSPVERYHTHRGRSVVGLLTSVLVLVTVLVLLGVFALSVVFGR